MKKKPNIENEIQKTLNSFNEIKRVEGNPYLMTRINEALATKQPRYGQSKLAAVSFSVLLMINIITLVSYSSRWNGQQETGLETLASEYDLQWNETEGYDLISPIQ